MSMMGELKFFLGLQIKRDNKGIYIHQQKYIKKLLKNFKMEDAKPMKTLMHAFNPLSKEKSGKLVDQTIYRGMIDSLLYMTFLGLILCKVYVCVLEFSLILVNHI